MAIDVDAPTQIVDNLIYQPVTIDRQRLRADSLRQRPEYRQSKLRASAAEALERQTFRNFFPDVTGTGAYGGSQTQLNEAWSVGLALNWSHLRRRQPDRPLPRGEGRTSKARRRGSRSTELDIIQNVEQAEIAVEEAQERIRAAQTAVASAQENFRLAQGRFDAGVGTILELTDAQLALTQAQNTEARPWPTTGSRSRGWSVPSVGADREETVRRPRASNQLMKRVVSLVVVALLVGGAVSGATSTPRAAAASPNSGPPASSAVPSPPRSRPPATSTRSSRCRSAARCLARSRSSWPTSTRS